MMNASNETAISAPIREAKPGDVVYERTAAGYVLLGLVTVAGTMEEVRGRTKAHIVYLHFSPRADDPTGVNGNVYDWQPKWDLIGVNTNGFAQEGYTLWSPRSAADDTYDAITGEVRMCPSCGGTTGKPVPYDFGRDPETGYHDAGEGCTECCPEVR